MPSITQLLASVTESNSPTNIEPNVPEHLQEKFHLPPFLPPNVLKLYLLEQEEGEDVETEDTGDTGDVGEIPGEEQLSITDIGRVVELKKIYSRLLAISDFLKGKGDPQFVKIRKAVDDALYLFEVIVNNFEQYKENINDIIIEYYRFIKNALLSIKKAFKRDRTEEEKKRKKRQRLLKRYTIKTLKR